MTASTPTDPTSPDLPDRAWQHLSNQLPPPPSAADRQDVLWQEYQAQFRWYDRAATRTRRGYGTLKVISLAVAAAVPVLAASHAPAALTASLAAVVVVIEGLVQLLQLQTNWISYRASAEALRQHGFLYAAEVDPYNDPATRRETSSPPSTASDQQREHHLDEHHAPHHAGPPGESLITPPPCLLDTTHEGHRHHPHSACRTSTRMVRLT